MLEVKVVHHFILDSCNAIHVNNDVMVVEEVKGSDDVVEFIV